MLLLHTDGSESHGRLC